MRLFGWVSLSSPFQHKISIILKKIIPKSLILPIIEGPLKGKKWIVNSSNFAYYLGNFKNVQMNIVKDLLHNGDIFYDIGANVGIYTLLSSEKVGNPGIVVAFEPLPANVRILNKHIQMNKCTNVRVIECALSNVSGNCLFFEHPDNTMGSISKNGNLEVPTLTLDSVVADGIAPPPDLIKMDVEGAESIVLRGGLDVLRNYCPTLLISLHSDQQRKECIDLLQGLGYSVQPIDDRDLSRTSDIIACKSKEGLNYEK